MNLKNVYSACAGAALLAGAGMSVAQPTIDGQLDAAFYGAPLVTQEADVIDIQLGPEVTVEFQTDNSNVGGKGGYDNPGNVTILPFPSDPATVMTGIEIAVPLSELGYNPGFGNTIRIAGFINGSGHDFLSNQVLGGFGAGEDPDNLGEPRGLDFNNIAGTQFVDVDVAPANRVNGPATVDGQLDAEYGMSPVWVNDIGTDFGDNSLADADQANGSEFNALWAYVGTDDTLYMLITGNLETNFNKLDLFFDVTTGGQSSIAGLGNPDIDFNALPRMGDNTDGSLDMITGGPTGPEATGLTFDTPFAADYFITYTNGNTPAEHYMSAAALVQGTGTGNFVGGGPKTSVQVITGTGPNNGPLLADSDNSNVLGVGGREPGPGTGSEADLSDPATVTTGIEFKVNLEGIGYDVAQFGGARGVPSDIGIGGFINGNSWNFLSNQIIGGITTFEGGGTGDPFNLGAPANVTDFKSWDGNQFVTLTPPSTLTELGSVFAADGSISMGEAAELTTLYVNTTNGAGFGDNMDSSFDMADGSEIDAVYAAVGLDNGVPTLFGIVTGNLHDFNRLQLFFDTKAGGQEIIRNDNARIDGDGLNLGLGGDPMMMEGLEWDAGFAPDYVLSYALGFNSDTEEVEHFVEGAELPTNGGGRGARLAFGELVQGSPISGSFTPRQGLKDNTDSTPGNANGTEMDAVYLYVDTAEGFAYFFVAGNLEPDFTNYVFFFDTLTTAGVGQNTLIADNPLTPENDGNPDIAFNALQRMGQLLEVDDSDPMNPQLIVVEQGLTFDAGFEADYVVTARLGNFSEQFNDSEIFGDWARLGDGQTDPGEGRYLGQGFTQGGGDLLGGTLEQAGQGQEPTQIDVDNSNTAGVAGGDDSVPDGARNPGSVTTGFEMKIRLQDLGWNGTDQMRFQVLVVNAPPTGSDGNGHGFVRNQSLASICGMDPGDPRQVDFSDEMMFPGTQFVGYPMASANPPGPCVAAPVGCDGDADGNQAVDVNDITFIMNRLGNMPGSCMDGDVDGNGMVDVNDLTFVINRLGTCETTGPCTGS